MTAFQSVLTVISFCKGSKKPASWQKPWFLSSDRNLLGGELWVFDVFCFGKAMALDTMISKGHFPTVTRSIHKMGLLRSVIRLEALFAHTLDR